jgi:hypothetical protein
VKSRSGPVVHDQLPEVGDASSPFDEEDAGAVGVELVDHQVEPCRWAIRASTERRIGAAAAAALQRRSRRLADQVLGLLLPNSTSVSRIRRKRPVSAGMKPGKSRRRKRDDQVLEHDRT